VRVEIEPDVDHLEKLRAPGAAQSLLVLLLAAARTPRLPGPGSARW